MKIESSYTQLITEARTSFAKIKDHRQLAKIKIPLVDHLACALGIFLLKFPSLLKFDLEVRKKQISIKASNFKNLFGVKNLPDDTNMRQTIDGLSPDLLRQTFKDMFNQLQKKKVLEKFVFYRGTYLLALDGTGFFSSKKIQCQCCCVKNHKDGTQTYYHQMLAASLVHPDFKQVIPLAPEPIQKQDGSQKNDCERNASKRFFENFRKEHPRLDVTVVEDALSSNVPHIQELKRHNMHFILGIKPGDHKNFFERLEEDKMANLVEHYETTPQKGLHRKFLFRNGILLKADQADTAVNYFEVIETNAKGKCSVFSWVTDFTISKNNVEKLMTGGRSRWRIENEVFNTLKNQGYEFEHNFGHGNENLSTCFAMLMLLAFFIDQASELTCSLYQKAREMLGPKYALWEDMRSIFKHFNVESWEILFGIITEEVKVSSQYILNTDTC